MTAVTLSQFRATLRLTWVDSEGRGEKILSYWNNQSVTHDACNREEVLHIVRRLDSSFYLQIANIVQEGSLEELEEALYEWASDEGWLD